MNDAERRAILDRDRWQCTEMVEPRTVRTVSGTFTFPRVARRCPVIGSEMVVCDGRAMCPPHARAWRSHVGVVDGTAPGRRDADAGRVQGDAARPKPATQPGEA